MNKQDNPTSAHQPIVDLQAAMLADSQFKALCEKHGLPWNPDEGYEPRHYNGPAPEKVQVLYMMAEPGAITETEKLNLLPAVTNLPWIDGHNLNNQEHYWRANLLEACRYIWPDGTESHMDAHLGGTNAFWMSLPEGKQTAAIKVEVLDYFLNTYLKPFLALFPNAVILAAGRKAQTRLDRLGVGYVACSAFTKPESNKPVARESWKTAGLQIVGDWK